MVTLLDDPEMPLDRSFGFSPLALERELDDAERRASSAVASSFPHDLPSAASSNLIWRSQMLSEAFN